MANNTRKYWEDHPYDHQEAINRQARMDEVTEEIRVFRRRKHWPHHDDNAVADNIARAFDQLWDDLTE